jgi:hypothetical protein
MQSQRLTWATDMISLHDAARITGIQLSGEIDSGVITTFDQVDHAAWPS